MARLRYANNVSCLLTEAIAADGTTLKIDAETGALPTLEAGDALRLTLKRANDRGNSTLWEIVEADEWSEAAGVYTLDLTERGAEGTTPRAYSVGDIAELQLTAEGIERFLASADTIHVQEFTATAAQTTFTVDGGYENRVIEVSVNGVMLSESDLDLTDGTDVVLLEAAEEDDLVRVKVYGAFQVADHYTKAEADTLLDAKAPTESPVLTGSITGTYHFASSLPVYHASSADGSGYGIEFSTDGGGTDTLIAAIKAIQIGADLQVGALAFEVADEATPVEMMRLLSGGLLVGRTTFPGDTTPALLAERSDGDWAIAAQSSNASVPHCLLVRFTGADPNNTTSFFIAAHGLGAQRFAVRANGGIENYQANNVNLSDERVKKDIEDAPSYWEKLKQLRVRLFRYRDQTHEDLNIGLIAQETEQVFPELVEESSEVTQLPDGSEVNLKRVYNSDLEYAVMKTLQEAQQRIEELEAKVAALEEAQ